ncbi:MAG: hypothetical protein NTZ78_00705 [Candidatus Aureabacteria bacterium]|nr:hypothetical protein [Candidatus Auribacterota bacterium]
MKKEIYLHNTLGWMIILSLAVGPGVVWAAKDFVVIEERISVSAPDKEGYITVSGPAKCVGISPGAIVTYIIENSKSKQQIQGTVNPDGSFVEKARATAGDKIKITLNDTATGGKKKVTKKVPQFLVHMSPGQGTTASAFERKDSRAVVVEPTPDVIIHYRKASKESAVGTQVNLDEEVKQSGVLPPD